MSVIDAMDSLFKYSSISSLNASDAPVQSSGSLVPVPPTWMSELAAVLSDRLRPLSARLLILKLIMSRGAVFRVSA